MQILSFFLQIWTKFRETFAVTKVSVLNVVFLD